MEWRVNILGQAPDRIIRGRVGQVLGLENRAGKVIQKLKGKRQKYRSKFKTGTG